MVLLDSKDTERLTSEKILWLSTVSETFIPHLVPVWFVLHESKLFICTSDKSIKYKHIQKNSNVAFALEDGINPLSGIGTVLIRSPNQIKDTAIIKKFKEKYNWNIATDKQYSLLLEIEISGILMRKNN